ncbi:uncharacterized protein CXQ87_001315 [Candidozyma duobushaemuli]|uniref:Uncharacterized protein n=2 Tax=Candidozyma TaxID=3303203 RepID=A0ABX8I1J2_9ASCO|nr:uncharacterized protein CXQ87_001315 [[Candida] duobushaemulonis]PVH18390.1 hypothetical protein CXQ87_001315 [[Candida] duobushaemulonis]QWU86927.1 hypothetical protein CA3LBN_001145 [[Candida] haemuloni]
MQLSTLALFASSAIAAETFHLKIVSDNSELNGKGIQGLHKGGGFGYFGVSDQLGQEFNYDADKKVLFQNENSLPANVGFMLAEIYGYFLAVGVSVDESDVTFDADGNFNIGKQLYACKQLNDPYRYFADEYGIVASDAPNDSCVKIALQKAGNEPASSSIGSYVATSVETPASSTSIHAGWNSTVTKDITVTGYTTYCPFATTLTIATCENKACGPKTITVSEASTVTITEECIVPKTSTEPKVETTEPGAKVSSAPKSTSLTTVAAVSTSPETSTAVVSSYEGGARRNAFGVAVGFAGAAALLI